MQNHRRLHLNAIIAIAAAATILGCSPADDPSVSTAVDDSKTELSDAGQINPQEWPRGEYGVARDSATEARIEKLLDALTVEQKVGQIIQADIGSVTPEDVRQYRLGSILNGGSSGPYGDDRASVSEWVRLADEFWDASMDPQGVETAIPIIWGIDAVHGHSNVVGATIFPHNIGLGAANNPELIEKIGAATAREIAATGLDWTFAPTLAVARDDRWGRSYESYSEDPRIVAEYGGAMVRGLQGTPGTDGFLGPDRVIATAKHFIADGGTSGGKDQGDARISEAELRDIHAAGYFSAIDAGVQSVMASFSSWNGQKMHGNRALLNDLLFDRLAFDGLVVGDWNGHGKLEGCSNENCAAAFNAGVDIFMAPDSWKKLYESTLNSVQSGEISMQRLNEAVSRILRVKLRAGVLDRGRPSSRPLAGNAAILGSAKHRELAREAVRESLVLLKNNGKVLPVAAGSNVLVVGAAADDMSQQTGGWTISWQGLDTTHADFPDGQAILEGIRKTVSAAGGHIEYSADGSFSERPDVAILVFGEKPYAEFKGDRSDVEFVAADAEHLLALSLLQTAGVPVVSVFLSGRPLWVNREMNQSDAFVAAWLPGTEGGGVADVLFDKSVDDVAYDFTGKLSFSWPDSTDQATVNIGDDNYKPLFPYGYGLRKTDTVAVDWLHENVASLNAAVSSEIFAAGRAVDPWQIAVYPQDERLALSNFDRFAQEDALRAIWNGPGSLAFEGTAVDMSRLAQPDAGFVVSMRVDSVPSGAITVSVENAGTSLGSLDKSAVFASIPSGEWVELALPFSCFTSDVAKWESVTAPLVITSDAPLSIGISAIRIASLSEADQICRNQDSAE